MTPPVLLKYREAHVIRVVKDWDEDWGRFIFRCEHDGLRIIRRERRNPRVMALENTSPHLWRHDPDEIRTLVRIERGEPIAW